MLDAVSTQKDSLRANVEFLRQENSMLKENLQTLSTDFHRQANHLDFQSREKQQLDSECSLLGEKVITEHR
eukprot:766164-Hanusia_phi.AAC.2